MTMIPFPHQEEAYEFSRSNPLLTEANRDLQREDSSHFFDLGMRYFREGDIDKAINAFEAQVQSDTEHSEVCQRQGEDNPSLGRIYMPFYIIQHLHGMGFDFYFIFLLLFYKP